MKHSILELYHAIKSGRVITVSESAIPEIERMGLAVYRPSLTDIVAEITRIESMAVLESEIKFEVYHKDVENAWLKEPEICLLEIMDIKNTRTTLSLKDYQETIKFIMERPEVSQSQIKGVSLKELETQRLYRGKCNIEIKPFTEEISIDFLKFTMAKMEIG